MIDVFNVLSIAFSFIASYFAIRCIRKSEGRDRLLLSLLIMGILTYAVGETIFTFFEIIGHDVFPSVADIFFAIGSLALVIGLFYFWMTSPKSIEHFEFKDIMLFLFVIVITAAILSYVFIYLALPQGLGSPIQAFLNIFYPVSSAFTFLQIFLLRNHFKESHLYHFFEYFGDGIFFLFIGDMMFTYSDWSGVAGGLRIAYNIIFMLGYGLITFAFFLESRYVQPAKWEGFRKIE